MAVQKNFFLGLFLVVGLGSGVLAAESKRASDAKELQITPEMIIGFAIKGADAVKLLDAELIASGVVGLKARSAFDPKISAEVRRLDNRFETTGGFAPERVEQNILKVGASRLLETGTMLRAELQHSLNANDLPAGLPPNLAILTDYSQSEMTLAVRQSLWRNQFGRTQQLSLAAADKLQEAALEVNISGKEDLALSYLQQFYQAWSAQQFWRFAKARVARQERLFRVTKVKQNRGTSEKQDVLQVESSVIASEQSEADARRALDDIWQGLVISLGLGAQYAAMDPAALDIQLGEPVQNALAACGRFRSVGTPPVIAAQRAAQIIEESASLQMDAAKDGVRPDLFLELAAAGNGIDEDSVPTLAETATYRHPRFSVALGIDWTIGPKSEEAAYLEAFKNKTTQQLRFTQLTSTLKVQWNNQCAALERLQGKEKAFQSVYEKQTERARLEEQRFRLGDADVFSVIQAENDITAAEQNLADVKAKLRLTSWQIRSLNNEFPELLRRLKGDL